MNEIIKLPVEATARSIDYVVTVTNREFADKIHKKILKNNPGVRIMKHRCYTIDELMEHLKKHYPIFEGCELTRALCGYEITLSGYVGQVAFVCDMYSNSLTFDVVYKKYHNFPSTTEDLPPLHEPDGYQSELQPPVNKTKDNYAEGADAIVEMQDRIVIYPLSLENKTFSYFKIKNKDEMDFFIRGYILPDLINDLGDNYIRYVLLSKPQSADNLIGMFAVRCGDCGKYAQGLFNGNPNMGDPAYQVYHRKNWFCDNFGWTYMGGHGYAGGRRMICPECSKLYKSGIKKLNGGKI